MFLKKKRIGWQHSLDWPTLRNMQKSNETIEDLRGRIVDAQKFGWSLCAISSSVKKKLLLQARLKFATAHMDEANGSWRKDLWSDQTKVKLFGHNGKRYVWRSKGDVFSPKYTVPTVKHGDGPVLLPLVHCTLQVDGIIKTGIPPNSWASTPQIKR